MQEHETTILQLISDQLATCSLLCKKHIFTFLKAECIHPFDFFCIFILFLHFTNLHFLDTGRTLFNITKPDMTLILILFLHNVFRFSFQASNTSINIHVIKKYLDVLALD